MNNALRLFAGVTNPALAELNSRQLQMPLSPCTIERFPVGEASARLAESVRGLRGLHYPQETETQADAAQTSARTGNGRHNGAVAHRQLVRNMRDRRRLRCERGERRLRQSTMGEDASVRGKEAAPHELRDREEEDGRAIEQAAVSRPDRRWQITGE